MNRIDDRIARLDSAAKDGELTARILGSFHRALREDGVDEAVAGELTLLYAKRIFANQRKG